MGLGAGSGGVGRRGRATQAAATPFAAAERGRRRISEELGLGDSSAHATRPLTPVWFCGPTRCCTRPFRESPPLCRRCRRSRNRSQKHREAAVTAMPKNKGNAAWSPGPRLRSIRSPRPCPRPRDSSGRSDLPLRSGSRRLGHPDAILGSGEELGTYSCLPVWSHWGGADAIFVRPPAGEWAFCSGFAPDDRDL